MEVRSSAWGKLTKGCKLLSATLHYALTFGELLFQLGNCDASYDVGSVGGARS